jgi:ribulose-5-phosphate 4-epimerase/fuculose-1-phosphate aldolase
LAVEVEELCAMYLLARQAGPVESLSEPEMAKVIRLFETYGTPAFPDEELVRVQP